MELKTTVYPFILRGVNLLGSSSATCPRPLREKIWQRINEHQIDWSKAVRAEVAPSRVPAECQMIADGKAWGRVIVDMSKA
jgi:hypothetical protein